ncbi:hypothetical protein MC50_011190 [Raoultella planticola]|nr:hypothetical protein MC50_011190 [Raoultella planticola]PNK78007.1 hypothetical protein CEP62_007925 [Raoultella planticola]
MFSQTRQDWSARLYRLPVALFSCRLGNAMSDIGAGRLIRKDSMDLHQATGDIGISPWCNTQPPMVMEDYLYVNI